jgi:hypothetical protein
MVPNRSYEALFEATRRFYTECREDPLGSNLGAEKAGRQAVAVNTRFFLFALTNFTNFSQASSVPSYEQVTDFYHRGFAPTRKPEFSPLTSAPDAHIDSPYLDRRLISLPPPTSYSGAFSGPRLEGRHGASVQPSVCFPSAGDPSPTPVSSPKTLLNIALAEYAIAHSAFYLSNEELLQASVDLAHLDLLGMKWD